jgi:NTE family protein
MNIKEMNNTNNDMRHHRALVLQGGGALGAYEVGVLNVLCEKLVERDKEKGIVNSPLFDIVAGTSIGAMNAAVLVSNVVKKDKTWSEAICELEKFWKEGIALKEGITPCDDIVPVGIFRIFPWWKPWATDSPLWAPCAQESLYPKDLDTKNLATEEAARRYYSAKEFVLKGKKCSPV